MPNGVKKTLGLIMLLPLLSFVLVPMASVQATHSFDAEIYVACETSTYATSASLIYSGHTVTISCPPSTSYRAEDVCFTVTRTTNYTAATSANGVANTFTGKMGPHFAPYGYIEYYSYAPDIDSYAYAYIGYCD